MAILGYGLVNLPLFFPLGFVTRLVMSQGKNWAVGTPLRGPFLSGGRGESVYKHKENPRCGLQTPLDLVSAIMGPAING